MESPKKISLEKILKESGLCSECLDKECSQDNLIGLAKHCDSTTVIGYALGLSKIQISDVERDNHTSEEKRVGLVLKWKESSAFKATYKRFVAALLACGRNNAATEICRQLAKETKVEADSGKTSASSSTVVSKQQSEQLHDTLSLSTEEQGLLKLNTFNDSEETTQPTCTCTSKQPVEPPSNEGTADLLPETSDPASNDGQRALKELIVEEECSSLRTRIDDLESDYQLIGRKLTNALEKSAVTLKDLQTYVATLSMSVRRCYEELQKKNQLPSQTKYATTMSDFVGVLYDYSNFLNPALLADTIKYFGDTETKSLMKVYDIKLDEFQKMTTLVQFVTECMYEEDLPEGYVEIELVMKNNWQEKTLKDIKPPKISWLLNKVYFGSLRVAFSIPDLSDLKEEDVREYFLHHVKHVLLNGEIILDLELEMQEALPDHTPLEETVQLIQEVSDIDRGHTEPTDIDFRFSSVTGDSIILSDDGREARRRDIQSAVDIWGDAGVYIDTPLSGKFEFELEIVSGPGIYDSSLEIGVAQCPRGSNTHLDIPYQIRSGDSEKFCYWRGGALYNGLGSEGTNTVKKYGTVNLHDLKGADTVATEVSASGDLSFYVNGAHQGVAARGLYGEDWDLYPVVNISGSCIGVKITRAVMSGCLHHAQDQICPMEKLSSSSSPIQYGFHPVTGENVMLLEDGLYARRRNPRYTTSDGVVYGSRPLNRQSVFEVQITEKHGRQNSSIQIGVMMQSTDSELKQSDIPENSTGANNHYVWSGDQVWNNVGHNLAKVHTSTGIDLIELLDPSIEPWPVFTCYELPRPRKYGSVNLRDLRQGDTVGMRVAYDGSLSFFVNRKSQGTTLKGLLKDGYAVYPVVDVQGNCHAVRITRAETHPEDQVLGLQELCLEKIASCLEWSSKDVNLLPLPPRQKNRLGKFIDYL